MHVLFLAAVLALQRYQGTWQVTRADAAAGSKPDVLVNQCAALGHSFVCQQTVNNQTGAVVVFIATEQPGHFYTQNIMPVGWASGRSDLQISGDTWTYTNTREQNGRSMYYRTLNVFSGNNRIHFEQAESIDEKTWKVTSSGDEVKVSR